MRIPLCMLFAYDIVLVDETVMGLIDIGVMQENCRTSRLEANSKQILIHEVNFSNEKELNQLFVTLDGKEVPVSSQLP